MVEIERKFLVNVNKWSPAGNGITIKQGYLSIDPNHTVRIRQIRDQAFLTIKGKSVGISRIELEYEVPAGDAEILFGMCNDMIVEKQRYIEQVGDMKWEVDVFKGRNKGLVMAEIELDHADQKIELPHWVEREVSEDTRFFNSCLANNPFPEW